MSASVFNRLEPLNSDYCYYYPSERWEATLLLVYKIYCVYLFLIQEWESNAGAPEGDSSGLRVGATVVKNITILCSFKENNIIYIRIVIVYHKLTTLRHNMFERYETHKKYFVIARTRKRVYFFVFI